MSQTVCCAVKMLTFYPCSTAVGLGVIQVLGYGHTVVLCRPYCFNQATLNHTVRRKLAFHLSLTGSVATGVGVRWLQVQVYWDYCYGHAHGHTYVERYHFTVRRILQWSDMSYLFLCRGNTIIVVFKRWFPQISTTASCGCACAYVWVWGVGGVGVDVWVCASVDRSVGGWICLMPVCTPAWI